MCSVLVPCLFITPIISSVLRCIICVVADSEGFSIPSSQAVVVEILFLLAALSYCLTPGFYERVFMAKVVVCSLISYYDSESFSEVFYVSHEKGRVLRAFLMVILYFFPLCVFHHIHYFCVHT